jgi:hypothetical protein
MEKSEGSSPPKGSPDSKKNMHRAVTTVMSKSSFQRAEVVFDEYQGYKRRRAFHVVLVSVILVLVFIQICFAVRIYRSVEKPWLKSVQDTLKLNNGTVGWLNMANIVDSEHVNVAIMMAIFTFMYGYDYMIGMGILCKYLLGMITFKFISVLMKEPRPYWINTLDPGQVKMEIIGYRCDPTFAMPDLAVVQLFWFAINFRDILNKSQIKLRMVVDKVFFWGAICVMSVLILIKYISGELFIMQASMTLLLGFIMLHASKYLTSYLRKAIERCTVGASLERKYILRYYILLMLIAIGDIILIITDDTYDHGQLKYIENLVSSALLKDRLQAAFRNEGRHRQNRSCKEHR